ncbi:MAG: hypothetical protein HYT64_01790 [Candidatus Yanofskybacteria bacterium]|nr:hypothetical protein [Candidatus Yanofskybacteria bacterium]
MGINIQDVHGLFGKEQRGQVESEVRHVLGLRTCEMNDEDYDAAVALLQFIGTKPNGIALSEEIVSFLGSKPYSFSPNRISELLKYLRRNNFICVGGSVTRRNVLGNLPIQLTSWRERTKVTIQ